MSSGQKGEWKPHVVKCIHSYMFLYTSTFIVNVIFIRGKLNAPRGGSLELQNIFSFSDRINVNCIDVNCRLSVFCAAIRVPFLCCTYSIMSSVIWFREITQQVITGNYMLAHSLCTDNAANMIVLVWSDRWAHRSKACTLISHASWGMILYKKNKCSCLAACHLKRS